jgi:hypothetical protein
MNNANRYEGRHDRADAFLPDPDEPGDDAPPMDELAELLATDFLGAATGGGDPGAGFGPDESWPEETGGPFLVTDGLQEFGMHDRTPGALEAEPTAVGAIATPPAYE